ncbi:MAG: DegV family protein [Anaerolineales bacterium]|nr:DegV family protein [Anaerolineales bacterium]MCZ2122091.1 DegV family protein [Anaerolineales bacterium]
MLRIVTDGAADILPEWEKEYGIDMIPVNILFGEESYLQGVDLDNEGFYKLVDESRKIPKTAQPSPHQFIEFYRKIAQKGDTILSIHITSKLSGTYASAISAAEELKGEFTVIPIDSASGSLGIGLLCREARKMERAGKTTEEIVASLEAAKEKICVILTLDTLEYAKLSGRVGTLQAALASVLNVKPIAVLRDGVVNIVEKVRTRKAALERVISMAKEEVGDKPVYLAVVHARDLNSGQALLEQAKPHFNAKEAMLGDLSVSIAANLGPGTVGLILYPFE